MPTGNPLKNSMSYFYEMISYEKNPIPFTINPKEVLEMVRALDVIRENWESQALKGPDSGWVDLRHAWMDLRNIISSIKDQTEAHLDREDDSVELS